MASFRGALRGLAQAALQAARVVEPALVYIEYDWPVAEAKQPAISVNTRRWRHEDRTNGAGAPQFWSTAGLLVEYRNSGTDRAAVVAQLDGADDLITTTLAALIVGPPQLGFRRIVAIDGDLRLDSSGARHEGALDVMLQFEYANDAEAEITDRLLRVTAAIVRDFAAGDGDVNAPLTESLASGDISIHQNA